MPKPAGKKKYSAKQMKIARVAPPRDKITGADFAKLRNGKKKTKGSKPVSRKRREEPQRRTDSEGKSQVQSCNWS